MTKIAIVTYSKGGNTEKMAKPIYDGIMKTGDVEVKLFTTDNADKAYLESCDGIIVGTPTYYATLAGKVKMWLEDFFGECNMAGKLGGAFATANYVHGGGDAAAQCILTHMLVDGLMVYSGGGASGNPTIHFGPVAIGDHLDDYMETFEIYGERFALQVKKISK